MKRLAGRGAWLWLASAVLGGAVRAAPDEAARTREARRTPAPRIGDRWVVKRFDFDERKLGNYEPIPMYWVRLRAEGFPHYLTGRFDEKVGHTAPPSFLLELDGGSLAFRYLGQDIPASPACMYRITAWVRTAGLDRARAYLSAYYLDRQGRRIPGTERFSQRIGALRGQEWVRIHVELPGGVEQARLIGLTVWLAQPKVWSTAPEPPRPIYREDLAARAWFDDIVVRRLPYARLAGQKQRHLFPPGQPAKLMINVYDTQAERISAELQVVGADAETVLRTAVPVHTSKNPEPHTATLNDLAPGLYKAILTVSTPETPLLRRQWTFAKLGPRISSSAQPERRFGVVLEQADQTCWPACRRLIEAVRVGWVKVPIDLGTQPGHADAPAATGPPQPLQQLLLRRIEPVGTLSHRPSRQGPGGWAGRSLLDVLGDDSAPRRERLASMFASYAGVIRTWQFGEDGCQDFAWDPRLVGTLERFRRECSRLTTRMTLVCPWPVQHALAGGRLPAERLSLRIPPQIAPERIPDHLRAFKSLEGVRLWAVIEPLDPQRYERLSCLADTAKRLVLTAASPVDVIFLRGLWRHLDTPEGPTIEPTENALVFRTVVDLLGSARFVGRMYVGRTAKCYIFDRNGQAVLVMWDDQADPQGTRCELYLGPQAKQFDLWGNELPSELVETGRSLRELRTEAAPFRRIPPPDERTVASTSRPAALYSVGPGTDELAAVASTSRPAALYSLYRPIAWTPSRRTKQVRTPRHDTYVAQAAREIRIDPRVQRHRLRIGPLPSFVTGTPTWLMRLRASFALVPAHVEGRLDVHTTELRFVNHAGQSISGSACLIPPTGWQVKPNRLAFTLSPGQQLRQTLWMRFPYNEAAGAKTLTVAVAFEADRRYQLIVPVPFTLGLAEIAVRTLAQVDGDRVIIRQSVSNRSGRTVSFEGFVRAPPWPAQHRLIARLKPAETVVKEYVLEHAAELAGRRVRVGLRELGPDGRIFNQFVEIP